MRVPRLHVVTDDGVLARSDVLDVAERLIRAHGESMALHVRGHDTPVRRLHDVTVAASNAASEAVSTGSSAEPLVVVNDRVDVALAALAHGSRIGVQLGRRSLPVAEARRILDDAVLGYSAHAADEAAEAASAGADFVVLGTIWPTASHPDEAGAGPALIEAAVAAAPVPVIAIGGVTPERAAVARAAGAHGVAVIRGVWSAADPVSAAGEYLESMERG